MVKDSIFLVTPKTVVDLAEVQAIARAAGYVSRSASASSMTLSIGKDTGESSAWTCYAIDLQSKGWMVFDEDETSGLLNDGFRTVLQFDCDLASLAALKPLLNKLLSEWEGFVMFEDFRDRYTAAHIDRFQP